MSNNGQNDKKAPKIRFKNFTNDWELKTLKDIATFHTGNGLSWNDVSYNGKHECILYGNLYTDYGIITDSIKYHTDKNLKNPFYSEFGDVLIPASDTTPTGLARATSVEKSGVIIGGDINIIRTNEKYDGSFLSLALNFNKKKLIKLITGTTVRHIHNSDIKHLVLSLPTLIEEQKNIVELFKSLDSVISLHQRKCEILKNCKKSLLDKMFPKFGETTPRIRFKGFTEDWELKRLGDLGDTFTGLSGKKADDFGHGKASFITYMNVFSNPIIDPAMVDHVEIDTKQREVQVGDVFFTTSSETPEDVGMSSVLKEKSDEVTYLNSFCFGFRPTYDFDLDYLAYNLRSEYVRKQIKVLAQGISRFNISKKQMMNIKISVSELNEQTAIGEFFSQLDNVISLHQKKCDMLEEIKKSLLQKMFC